MKVECARRVIAGANGWLSGRLISEIEAALDALKAVIQKIGAPGQTRVALLQKPKSFFDLAHITFNAREPVIDPAQIAQDDVVGLSHRRSIKRRNPAVTLRR